MFKLAITDFFEESDKSDAEIDALVKAAEQELDATDLNMIEYTNLFLEVNLVPDHAVFFLFGLLKLTHGLLSLFLPAFLIYTAQVLFLCIMEYDGLALLNE